MPAITKDEAIQVLRDVITEIAPFCPESGSAAIHRAYRALAATEHITEAAATQAAACPQCRAADGKHDSCCEWVIKHPDLAPTDLSAVEVPPLPSHPEPEMAWTKSELASIKTYGEACARASMKGNK